MSSFRIVPQIRMYSNFGEFAEAEGLGKDDLLLTNEYIYDPFVKQYNLSCGICFQEKYGAGEPTDIMVESIVGDISLSSYKRIIAVGGGTIIDISKILALKEFTDVEDLYSGKPLEKEKKLYIVPTTCGTGSEVTNVAVLNRTKIGTKSGLVGEALYADQAVLIPEFLNSLPLKVFATSSIDALVHAVESFLNPLNNAFIEMYAVQAMSIIISSYKSIVSKGLESRKDYYEKLAMASCMAGIAFGNNGCGAVHALSYALGGKYHVPHGESNYQFFTAVLKVYEEKMPEGKIGRLKRIIADLLGCGIDEAIEDLEALLSGILENKYMCEYGAVEEDVIEFTRSTVKTQQRLLKGSYIQLTDEDVEYIYRKRLKE